MRALWLVRRNLTQHPGGDTTQILKTAAAVRTRGVEVEFADTCPQDLGGFDVAHLFHLDRLWENTEHSARLAAAGLPAVLSTIYWPCDEFDRQARVGVQGWLARRVGSSRYQDLRLFQRYLLHCCEQRRMPTWTPGRFSFRQRAVALLQSMAVLLPNSRTEADVIADRFGTVRPVVPVPNAADADLFGLPRNPGVRSGVVCIGRIEPRKNQLALLHALADTQIPLTFVGQPGRYSQGYYDACRRVAPAHVRFVPAQPAEALRGFYERATVHACVSWYETPGLASLEAGLCGCALVVTPGGSTREYFAGQAHYAEPGDVQSIAAAVRAALATGPEPRLASRIAEEFTWEAAATRTIEGYELAIRNTRQC
ncbi:MAG: glycosyltransferase family 4 protein [Phycisphaerales bacterium]|nr:glycosyltransferase family 4 protein [Phycisphaerales bacterium]